MSCLVFMHVSSMPELRLTASVICLAESQAVGYMDRLNRRTWMGRAYLSSIEFATILKNAAAL